MESSISPSTSRPEESARTLWNKVSQFEWEAPTNARSTTTRRRQPVPDEALRPTQIERFLLLILITLFLYVFFRLDAFLLICRTIQTLELEEVPLHHLYSQVWTMNLLFDFLFVFFEMATIMCQENIYGILFITLLRFAHFAFNLKQVIQPEIPEHSLVRQKLSHIYSLDVVYLHLLINFLLCYLLSRLVYIKIANYFGNKSSSIQPATPTTISQQFRKLKRSPLRFFLLITLSIFLAIRWLIVPVDYGAKEALKLGCVPEDRLGERLRINQAWAANVAIDFFSSLFELIAVPIAQSFHGTIFFIVLRFAHLAANLKQVIHPELPEDAWLRERYSSIYSPFYVYLHLLFNLTLSCLLPVFLFQLYRREKAEKPNPAPTGINVNVEALT